MPVNPTLTGSADVVASVAWCDAEDGRCTAYQHTRRALMPCLDDVCRVCVGVAGVRSGKGELNHQESQYGGGGCAEKDRP